MIFLLILVHTNPLLIGSLAFVGICLGYHIWIVINGVATNPADDPPIDGGGESVAMPQAIIDAQNAHPHNITKTFYVSESPKHMESFEKMVIEWTNKHKS